MDFKAATSVFKAESSFFKADTSKRSSATINRISNIESNEDCFDETSCGEPLVPQHLCIDFTPVDEVDTDFVQKKCVAFWDFINNTPEIQNLKVMPEKESKKYEDVHTGNEDLQESSPEESEDDSTKISRTAVSMLEFVEGKGLIDRTFEAKLPQSRCTLGSREYLELESVTPKATVIKDKSGSLISKKVADSGSHLPSKQMKSLSKTMDEWDKTHPKSMEPPGHAPALQHCVMQRKIP